MSSSQDVSITLTDVNEAPVITSAATASVEENGTAAFTATATDVDGDTLSYTLTGTDAALFTVDAATGVVSFIDAPDFETPGDSDGDNVYDLTVTTSDGELSASQDVAITVTDVDEIPPETPIITSLGVSGDIHNSLDMTASPNGAFIVITGIAEAGSTVEVFSDSVSLGTTLVQADGSFRLATAFENVESAEITAIATDPAGNVSDQGIFSDFLGFDVSTVLAEIDAPIITISDLTTDTGIAIISEGNLFIFPRVSDLGDVNNDGFDDIGVGLIDSVTGELAGQIAVIYGGDDGFGTLVDGVPTIDLDTLSSEDGIIFQGAEDNDFVANLSSVGDFNGDGIDDFIVGGAGADIGAEDSGVAYLIFGSEDGFGAETILGQDIVDLGELSESQGIVFFHEEEFTFFSAPVSNAGDINGDGLADVVISDVSFNGGEGGAFVVYGTTEGLGEVNSDGLRLVNLEELTPEQGFLVAGNSDSDFLGFSVRALGDLNGDGIDDFGITDPIEGGFQGAGYIIFGSEEGLGLPDETGLAVIDIFDPTTFDGVRIIDNVPESFILGRQISSAGDFNGDGFNDIIVTISDTEFSTFLPTFGSAYILYGSEDGFGEDDGAGGLVIDLSSISAEQGITLTSTLINEFGTNDFGDSVDAIGDFNADGYDDIIISDPSNEGRAYIIFGGDSVGEIDEDGGANLDVQDLSLSEGIVVQGTDFDAELGNFVRSAGDINGDGVLDVILTAADGFVGPPTALVLFGGQSFISDDFNQSFALVDENTTAAHTALSLGEGTEFTLVGDDADLFTIDQETGLISFIDAPDFESIFGPETLNEIVEDLAEGNADLGDLVNFNLEVVAVNGEHATREFISIVVNDVNEFAPEFQTSDSFVLAEGGPASFTVVAIDADGGNLVFFPDGNGLTRSDFVASDIEYAISGGADADLFVLNPAFIEAGDIDALASTVSFIAAPTVDNPTDTDGDGIYEIEITVSDGEFETTQTIQISLVEAGEAPVFTSPNNFSIDETLEFQPLTDFNVVANDPEGADVSYSITGGIDNFFFSIDSLTGQIRLNQNLDFEGPRDANFDNIYEVEVTAFDGVNSSTQLLLIEVNDVDLPPVFLLPDMVSLQENQQLGLGQIGRDPEGQVGPEGIISTITGGADADLFVLGAGSFFGFETLLFIEEPDFENPLDSDGDNIYEVEITITDGNSSVSQLVSIEITDLFESPNAPIFTTADTVVVDEAQSFVIDVNADDADGEAPTYSIVGGEDQFDFFINSQTGELNFAFPPEFNQPGSFNDNFYEVIVEAFDGTGNRTEQIITVEVVDVNVAPVFDSPLPDSLTLNENENFSNFFSVSDFFDDEAVTVTLEGVDAAFFVLTDVSEFSTLIRGNLELLNPLDFENPQDSDGDNVYVVDVVASDGVNRTVQTVEVTILDEFESDNAPVFTTVDTLVVDEGQRFVLEVNADDADGEIPSYSIVGGDDQFDFNINSATGELNFNFIPSFTSPRDDNRDNIYNVVVEAFDGSGNRTLQTINIEVVDANVAPIFGSTLDATRSLMENANFSDFFSVNDFIDVEAVTISLEGADAAFFTLNNLFDGSISASANLELLNPLDFENPQDADGDNVYVVDVVASDGVNRTVQTVEVTILDEFESDNAPVFTTVDTLVVNEGQRFVLEVNADDADGEIPTYSIVGGDDQFDFNIDSETGELNFNSTPDFTSPRDDDRDNIYNVVVEAFDGSGNRTEQTINIEVVDANVAPIFLTNLNGNRTLPENTDFSADFLVSDSIDNEAVTVSLEGADAAFFTISVVNTGPDFFRGNLELLSRLDFENPQDADGDNVYVVDLVASDGVNRTVQTIELMITDVFESENAPIFTTADTVMVDEGQPFVLEVNAVDADGETPTYSIVGGEDQFDFVIDSLTGELNFLVTPDFNTPRDENRDNVYNLVIEAFDGTGNRTLQTLNIEVLDANVAPFFSSTLVANRSLTEGLNFSDFFSAFDPFDNDNVTLSLEGDDAAFFILENLFDDRSFAQASLELLNPLDFENPQDADGDNVYVVDVVASDGVNRTVQTVEVTILDDPSDNTTAISISESFLALDSSFAFEAGAEALFNDIISPEFSEALLVSDVFELATLNEASELGSPTEDDFWTIKSVALDSEVVAEEVSDTESLDEAYSGIDDDVFEIAAPSDIGEDVWF